MRKAIYRYISLIILMGLCAGLNLIAQEDQVRKISPYMLFTYLKNSDSQKILQVKITNITQTGETPLKGLAVRFLNNATILGDVVTNESGYAELVVMPDVELYTSADGSWPFIAQFEGDSLVDATTAELSITDVNLEMTLSEDEGKKMVTLTASLPSPDGPVPVAGEEISVYVTSMFSLLPVATGTFEADGTVVLIFPDDLPGDSNGDLIVIGRFNDHYLYGNVEKRELMHWGTPVVKTPPAYRSLWSTLAPRWMIITLSIMLLGVWGHYTFVIISLIRIRKNGKQSVKS